MMLDDSEQKELGHLCILLILDVDKNNDEITKF